jgi:hypothetical protein
MENRPRAIVRVDVSGALAFAEAGRLRAAMEERTGIFGALECRDSLVARPTAADLASLDAGGYLREAIDHLVAAVEAGGEGASEAEEALILLYRLAGEAA